jgi:anti-anti-sigma factor
MCATGLSVTFQNNRSGSIDIVHDCHQNSKTSAESENVNNGNLEIITRPGGREGLRILALKGRLTIETAAYFQDAIKREDAPDLIIDMSGVPSMDSAGLGVMIAAYMRAKKTSRNLGIAAMNERVKAVTDTTRLSRFLQIYATVKDAEAALSKGQ